MDEYADIHAESFTKALRAALEEFDNGRERLAFVEFTPSVKAGRRYLGVLCDDGRQFAIQVDCIV